MVRSSFDDCTKPLSNFPTFIGIFFASRSILCSGRQVAFVCIAVVKSCRRFTKFTSNLCKYLNKKHTDTHLKTLNAAHFNMGSLLVPLSKVRSPSRLATCFGSPLSREPRTEHSVMVYETRRIAMKPFNLAFISGF